MAMFAALYAQASPDGPAHFPEVWEKVRAMWAEPFDWTADVARIAAPTLVIVGDDDYITVAHAEEFSRLVEHGQLAVVPGASHLVPMEKPDLFNQLVLDFSANPAPRRSCRSGAGSRPADGVRVRGPARYSWTSSISVPNEVLGWMKATVVPREPGRGASSMTRPPASLTACRATAQSATRYPM